MLASTGKVFSAGGDFDFVLALRADTAQRIRGCGHQGRRELRQPESSCSVGLWMHGPVAQLDRAAPF